MNIGNPADNNENQEQNQQHIAPLATVLQICRGNKEFHEFLMRNGKVLPKLTATITTTEYLRGVYNDQFWVPRQNDVKWRNCPQPPTMIVLVEKFNSIAQRQGFSTGIDPKRKNHPDQ
jgi:hypothetical protein